MLCQSVSLLFHPSAYALENPGSLCISLRTDKCAKKNRYFMDWDPILEISSLLVIN